MPRRKPDPLQPKVDRPDRPCPVPVPRKPVLQARVRERARPRARSAAWAPRPRKASRGWLQRPIDHCAATARQPHAVVLEPCIEFAAVFVLGDEGRERDAEVGGSLLHFAVISSLDLATAAVAGCCHFSKSTTLEARQHNACSRSRHPPPGGMPAQGGGCRR